MSTAARPVPASGQRPDGEEEPVVAEVRLDPAHARQIIAQLADNGRAAEADAMSEMLRLEGALAVRMPVAQAFESAMAMLKKGGTALPRAEIFLRAVLKAEPAHAEARHFLGVALHNRKRSRQAMPHLARSMRALADRPWAWSNLGVVHRERNELDEAETAYRRALALKEDYPEAHNNLGVVLRWLRRPEDARRHFERAIALRPDYVEAHLNLGRLQFSLREMDAAMASFSRAILLAPKTAAPSRNMLARAHLTLGQRDKAAEIYREWIAAEPDDPAPRHLLAACLGENAPERASDDYVATAFDGFAATFDAKLAHLRYRAPQLVAAALMTAHQENESFGVVADAGCGTGLCAPLIRDRCARLIGVDLSAGMIEKAKERGGYDELHVGELTAFLAARPGAFDTVVSADTLCYFGVLSGFAEAAFAAIKPGGVLVFTVEALPDDSPDAHQLRATGRYAHRRSYLEETLSAAGFAIEAARAEPLRLEDGKPVAGWLVTARRPT